ncbi:MAG: thioesterase family protein [Bacteroidota bacterium]
MSRITLALPVTFTFKTDLTVRVDDVNYGNHLSNHVYLSYMQEARMQYLGSFGYSEMDLAGVSVIMGDTAIVFKQECFYGDRLTIEVTASGFGSKSFELYYRFSKTQTGELVCEAKTGMVCFDYSERKSVPVPEAFILLVKSSR